jgi:hypothetical protein
MTLAVGKLCFVKAPSSLYLFPKRASLHSDSVLIIREGEREGGSPI